MSYNEQNLAWELDKSYSIIFLRHISENDYNKSCTDLVTRSLSLGVVKNCSNYPKIFFKKASRNLNWEVISFSWVCFPNIELLSHKTHFRVLKVFRLLNKSNVLCHKKRQGFDRFSFYLRWVNSTACVISGALENVKSFFWGTKQYIILWSYNF